MKRNLYVVLAAGFLSVAETRGLLERRQPPSSKAPMTPDAAAPWDAHAGLRCVGWRTTLTCSPSGPRDPMQDKDCFTIIAAQESGFCECEGYVHTAAVPCGHTPVNCTQECNVLQKLHRETFGAGGAGGSGRGGNDDEDGAAFRRDGDDKDPYASAMKYGHEATNNLNIAVRQSNTMLTGAREMISKMMDLKPWAQITQLGKDAEEAGQKTRKLAKLARPFIYTQVSSASLRSRQSGPANNVADCEKFLGDLWKKQSKYDKAHDQCKENEAENGEMPEKCKKIMDAIAKFEEEKAAKAEEKTNCETILAGHEAAKKAEAEAAEAAANAEAAETTEAPAEAPKE